MTAAPDADRPKVVSVDLLEDEDGYLRSEIAGILREMNGDKDEDEEVLGLDAAWRLATKVLAKICSYAREGA